MAKLSLLVIFFLTYLYLPDASTWTCNEKNGTYTCRSYQTACLTQLIKVPGDNEQYRKQDCVDISSPQCGPKQTDGEKIKGNIRNTTFTSDGGSIETNCCCIGDDCNDSVFMSKCNLLHKRNILLNSSSVMISVNTMTVLVFVYLVKLFIEWTNLKWCQTLIQKWCWYLMKTWTFSPNSPFFHYAIIICAVNFLYTMWPTKM